MTAPRADMRGRTVMLTGFTAGLGRAAAFALAELGADLVGVCRDPDKGARVVAEIGRQHPAAKLDVLVGDLGVARDVRRIADAFRARGRPLDVLWNNAGVIQQTRTTTEDGFETMFAVNHLGPFLLTNLLLDPLRAAAGARVVCTASDAHRFGGRLDFDDLQSEKRFSTFGAYGRSKLANILFASELARREARSRIRAYSFHPGFVASDFAKNNGRLARVAMALLAPFARSPVRGAETGVYLCTEPVPCGRSGDYFYDVRPRRPAAAARDAEAARRLWDTSLVSTGLAGDSGPTGRKFD